MSSSPDNPYKRLNYRRLIAWPARIERESPFLEEEIHRSPEQSVIDLGCGTGEHARHLASLGFRAVGIDRSGEQIEKARDYEDEFPPHGPAFLGGEIEDLPDLTDERFGAAICLGNVLPHLDDEPLGRALEALAACLLLGGRLLLQIVNYERIITRGDRHLPLNFRSDPEQEGEIVFLRLMKPDGDRHVRFFPSTLLLQPGEDPPLSIKAAREVRLRAWRLSELETALGEYGFRIDGTYGDMDRAAFEPEESSDLILTATLEGPKRTG
jgi:glycine/sarcosine N-methyltransferase